MSNEWVEQIPEWRCHKIVRASKILEIKANMLTLEGIEKPAKVTEMYLSRNRPEPGGYFVIYDDGYESYSPKKAFEEGYSTWKPNIMALERLMEMHGCLNVRIEEGGAVTVYGEPLDYDKHLGNNAQGIRSLWGEMVTDREYLEVIKNMDEESRARLLDGLWDDKKKDPA